MSTGLSSQRLANFMPYNHIGHLCNEPKPHPSQSAFSNRKIKVLIHMYVIAKKQTKFPLSRLWARLSHNAHQRATTCESMIRSTSPCSNVFRGKKWRETKLYDCLSIFWVCIISIGYISFVSYNFTNSSHLDFVSCLSHPFDFRPRQTWDFRHGSELGIEDEESGLARDVTLYFYNRACFIAEPQNGK